ncbi:hypothetical protein ANN_19607 [Periplaneta americana]|uniref:Uncharacterized protein n=1 Tax=Periplaneta americana TaxID=6978 RepID=A0ABQ8SAX5_PERAM|nr:hypothetical protein ANN_19607 [Periplaneta americana]
MAGLCEGGNGPAGSLKAIFQERCDSEHLVIRIILPIMKQTLFLIVDNSFFPLSHNLYAMSRLLVCMYYVCMYACMYVLEMNNDRENESNSARKAENPHDNVVLRRVLDLVLRNLSTPTKCYFENDERDSKRTRMTSRDSKDKCSEHSERERQLVLFISSMYVFAINPWNASHRPFAVEMFFKSIDAVIILTQHKFRQHLNINRYGQVASRNTILFWANDFRTTSSASYQRMSKFRHIQLTCMSIATLKELNKFSDKDLL